MRRPRWPCSRSTSLPYAVVSRTRTGPRPAASSVTRPRRCEAGGADVVLICTNLMHKVADAVDASISVPLLHIADAVAAQAQRHGWTRLGLLGARWVMEETFYADRLAAYGISVVTPDAAGRAMVDRVIFAELTQGRVEPESRDAYAAVVADLAGQGAEAVILGCTEIGLLLTAADSPLPLIDSMQAHALAAVDFALAEPALQPSSALLRAASREADLARSSPQVARRCGRQPPPPIGGPDRRTGALVSASRSSRSAAAARSAQLTELSADLPSAFGVPRVGQHLRVRRPRPLRVSAGPSAGRRRRRRGRPERRCTVLSAAPRRGQHQRNAGAETRQHPSPAAVGDDDRRPAGRTVAEVDEIHHAGVGRGRDAHVRPGRGARWWRSRRRRGRPDPAAPAGSGRRGRRRSSPASPRRVVAPGRRHLASRPRPEAQTCRVQPPDEVDVIRQAEPRRVQAGTAGGQDEPVRQQRAARTAAGRGQPDRGPGPVVGVVDRVRSSRDTPATGAGPAGARERRARASPWKVVGRRSRLPG